MTYLPPPPPTPPPVPFSSPKPKWPKWPIPVSIVALLLLVVIVISGSNDDTDDEAAVTTTTEQVEETTTTEPPTTTERPTTTTSTSTTTTTTAPPTTTTLDPQAQMTADMQVWSIQAYPVVTDLSDVFTDITTAAENYDLPAMNEACWNLSITINEAMGLPPAPDPAVEAPWRQALDAYDRAADACTDGTTNPASGRLDESATLLGEGLTHLTAATDALDPYLVD